LFTKTTYKTPISILLLLFYLFIVTPTNYWHSHSTIYNSEATSKKIICERYNGDVGTNCSICSQHNGVFDRDALTPQVNFYTSYSTIAYVFLEQLVFNIKYAFSNKGPPYFIA
jgi:hypothetical protein